MTYPLVWTENDLERVARKHGQPVADATEKKLRQLEEQLDWFDKRGQVTQRVDKVYQHHIGQVRYNAAAKDYRLYLILVEDGATFYTVTSKQGSEQEKAIHILESNLQDAVRDAKVRLEDRQQGII